MVTVHGALRGSNVFFLLKLKHAFSELLNESGIHMFSDMNVDVEKEEISFGANVLTLFPDLALTAF